jgi:hypothetical protein
VAMTKSAPPLSPLAVRSRPPSSFLTGQNGFQPFLKHPVEYRSKGPQRRDEHAKRSKLIGKTNHNLII